MKAILFFSVLISTTIKSYGQFSMLDSTFGIGGLVKTSFTLPNHPNQGSFATSIIIQPDGKMVVAGRTGGFTFALVRYLSNGSFDNTFGNGGKVLTLIGASCTAYSIALQTDGKIIVAGSTDAYFGRGDFAIARYNTDGSLDNSFGANGIVTTDFGSSNDYVNSIVIQADGKLVAVGQYTVLIGSFSNYFLGIARYNTNGSLDNSFGGNGKVTLPILNGYGKSVDIQGDGKIVVGSTRISGLVNNYNILLAIARFKTDGTVDNAFGNNGFVTTDLHNNNIVYITGTAGIKIQVDGKILSGAYANGSGACKYCNNFALVRYNADGTLDATFGNNGIVITNLLPGKEQMTSCLAIDQNKIILGGYIDSTDVDDDFTLVRYDMNGLLDSSFGNNGIIVTDFTLKKDDYLLSMAVQSDHKIVAAGSNEANDGLHQIGIARYKENRVICHLNVKLGNDTTLCEGEKLVLNTGITNARYLWQDNSTISSYTVTKPGKYWVEVIQNNCQYRDTITIASKNCTCIQTIPKAFTPNGDGVNDRWIIAKQNCILQVDVSVFNRYGSLVYQKKNYQNEWDGTYGLKPLPDATYYYAVKVIRIDRSEQILKGDLTILR